MTYYLTKSNVLVRTEGRPSIHNGEKRVPCFRVSTGGWHGWLKLRNLRRADAEGRAK